MLKSYVLHFVLAVTAKNEQVIISCCATPIGKQGYRYTKKKVVNNDF